MDKIGETGEQNQTSNRKSFAISVLGLCSYQRQKCFYKCLILLHDYYAIICLNFKRLIMTLRIKLKSKTRNQLYDLWSNLKFTFIAKFSASKFPSTLQLHHDQRSHFKFSKISIKFSVYLLKFASLWKTTTMMKILKRLLRCVHHDSDYLISTLDFHRTILKWCSILKMKFQLVVKLKIRRINIKENNITVIIWRILLTLK